MVKTNDIQPDVVAAQRILTVIGALRREVRRRAGAPWPDKELSNAQADLLRVVRRRPGVSVAEAADEMGVAPNTVSTLVGQLVRREDLERVQDPTDRRVARLQLAASARVLATQWQDQRADLVASVIATYGARDRRLLAESSRILADLTERIRAAQDVEVQSQRKSKMAGPVRNR